MATASNQRDVRLGVEIETAGEDNLKRLAAEVRGLAKEGGDAAPQYTRLADEIDRLGQQAKELTAFKQLGADLAVVNAEVQQAVLRASELRTQYQSQETAINAARAAQATLRTEINAVTKELADNRREQDLLKAAVQAGKVDDEQAAASKERLASAFAVLRERAAGLKADLKIADAATADAARGFSALGTAAESASVRALELQRSFARQNADLQEAANAAVKAGVGVSDLAAAQEALDAALRGSVAQITGVASATRQLALAEEQAAAAVESELAAIRESEAFVTRYAAAKEAASAAALEYVLAVEREAAANEKASRRQAELNAQSEVTATRLRREAEIVGVLEAAEREAAASKAALIEADRLLAVETAALAAARQRGVQALEEENAAIREAAALTQRYELAQRLAREEAVRLVQAQEASAVAAEKASRRQAELNAVAEKTARDAKYVRDLEQALAAVEREAQQAATATQRLQGYFEKLGAQRDIVDKAFGTTGVRSIQTIEQEVFRLNQSMQLLQSELRQGNISMQDFERASGSAALRLAALKREIATVPGNAGIFNQLADGANNLITRFGALSAAVATAGFAFKPLIDATIALDQTRRVLTTVSGSAEAAASQIEFLRGVSQRAGQQFDQIAQSYSKFAASALQSGLNLRQVQDVFTSVSLAAGNLGLSTDQTKRALEALGQIASKGTVSMEELRQQLGDALPGVLPLLAKELGLTQRQLNQVVESGNLMAREAIPAIGRSLQSLQAEGGGRVEGLVASWNRFVNVIKQGGVELVEGPLGKASGVVLGGVARLLEVIVFTAASASAGIEFLGKSLAAVAALVSGGTRAEFLKNLDEAAQASASRIASLRDTVESSRGTVTSLAEAVKPLGDSYAALAIKIDEADRAAQLNARTSEVRMQAAQKEAEAIKLLADLSPRESDAAQLRLEAATNYATAANAAAAAADAEAEALRRGRDAMLAKAGANEEERKSLEEVLKKRGEEIQKADAAAEKLQAVATAANNAAKAAEDAAAKIGDQSTKLTEIANEALGAQRAYDALVRRFEAGKATTEDVRGGAEALARAHGRLKDALNDLSEALQRRLGLMRAENELQRQGLQFELEKAKNALADALQLGNETAARQALVRIKELELALSRKGIDLKRQEAEAELKELGVLEDQLRASGLLTEAKAIEIETRRKLLQAKVLESAANEEGNKQAVREVENLRAGKAARDENSAAIDTNTGRLTSNTGASSSNTSSTRDNTAARKANSDAISGQVDALTQWEERLARTTRGFEGGVSGDGIAGIGPSQNGVDFGVRSAGGEANKVNGLPNIDSFGNLIRNTPNGGITRTGNGAQLQTPDGTDNWEFINDAGYGAFQNAASLQYVVPGIGYWKRKNATPGGPGSFSGVQDITKFRDITNPNGNTFLPAQNKDGSFATPQGQAGQVNKDGTISLTFNFGPGRSYGVTARNYAEAQALARELEQQFAMNGGG